MELAFEVDDLVTMQQKLGNRATVQQIGWGNAIETIDPHGTRLNLYPFDSRPLARQDAESDDFGNS